MPRQSDWPTLNQWMGLSNSIGNFKRNKLYEQREERDSERFDMQKQQFEQQQQSDAENKKVAEYTERLFRGEQIDPSEEGYSPGAYVQAKGEFYNIAFKDEQHNQLLTAKKKQKEAQRHQDVAKKMSSGVGRYKQDKDFAAFSNFLADVYTTDVRDGIEARASEDGREWTFEGPTGKITKRSVSEDSLMELASRVMDPEEYTSTQVSEWKAKVLNNSNAMKNKQPLYDDNGQLVGYIAKNVRGDNEKFTDVYFDTNYNMVDPNKFRAAYPNASTMDDQAAQASLGLTKAKTEKYRRDNTNLPGKDTIPLPNGQAISITGAQQLYDEHLLGQGIDRANPGQFGGQKQPDKTFEEFVGGLRTKGMPGTQHTAIRPMPKQQPAATQPANQGVGAGLQVAQPQPQQQQIQVQPVNRFQSIQNALQGGTTPEAIQAEMERRKRLGLL